jgi:hypothetical protein
VLPFLLAATVAGCGGAGGGSGVGLRAYRVQAQRICVEGNVDARRLSEKLDRVRQGAEPDAFFPRMAKLTREAVATARPYLDRLDALQPPADAADDLDGWVADQRRRITLLGTLADAFDARDEAAISRISEEIDMVQERASVIVRKYGLTECAATL